MLHVASQSKTRHALLSSAGVSFCVAQTDFNERHHHQTTQKTLPREIAITLADAKALSAINVSRGAHVLGADQTLDDNGRVLHKPDSIAEARDTLLALRGKTHTLHSAAAIAVEGNIHWRACQSVEITLRNFSDAALEAYLLRYGGQALSSVGCYQVEGAGIQLIEHIHGDYFAILGLPLLPLLAYLRQEGHLIP